MWIGSTKVDPEHPAMLSLCSTAKPPSSSRKSLVLELLSPWEPRQTAVLSVSLSLLTDVGGVNTSATVKVSLLGWQMAFPLSEQP